MNWETFESVPSRVYYHVDGGAIVQFFVSAAGYALKAVLTRGESRYLHIGLYKKWDGDPDLLPHHPKKHVFSVRTWQDFRDDVIEQLKEAL